MINPIQYRLKITEHIETKLRSTLQFQDILRILNRASEADQTALLTAFQSNNYVNFGEYLRRLIDAELKTRIQNATDAFVAKTQLTADDLDSIL